jgi:hypothetical protein
MTCVDQLSAEILCDSSNLITGDGNGCEPTYVCCKLDDSVANGSSQASGEIPGAEVGFGDVGLKESEVDVEIRKCLDAVNPGDFDELVARQNIIGLNSVETVPEKKCFHIGGECMPSDEVCSTLNFFFLSNMSKRTF